MVFASEEREEMKFIQGKFYKTRDDKKAFIDAITSANPISGKSSYMHGAIENYTNDATWTLDGHASLNEKLGSDLIDEWTDHEQTITITKNQLLEALDDPIFPDRFFGEILARRLGFK